MEITASDIQACKIRSNSTRRNVGIKAFRQMWRNTGV